jgi:hypothetical protein
MIFEICGHEVAEDGAAALRAVRQSRQGEMHLPRMNQCPRPDIPGLRTYVGR